MNCCVESGNGWEEYNVGVENAASSKINDEAGVECLICGQVAYAKIQCGVRDDWVGCGRVLTSRSY